MELTSIKILRGPNYWSVNHPHLIVLKLEIPELKEDHTDLIFKKAVSLFPALSEKEPGESSADANLVYLIQHLALALQHSAGMLCTFGKTRSCGEGQYCVAIEYEVERAGVYAAKCAVRIIQSFLRNETPGISEDIELLKEIKRKYGDGPTTKYILSEVKKRHIPIRHMNAGLLVTLGYGKNQKKLRTAVADTTSGLGMELASDKEEAKNILLQSNVPTPRGIVVQSEDEIIKELKDLKFPLAIKPLSGNHGRGVTTRINSEERARFGFRLAKRIHKEVIVEEFIEGEDFRFLVIDYKLTAVAKRVPAHVKGDGHSSIQQLIDEENKNPQRGDTDEHVLAPIKVDEVTERILAERSLTLGSVLKSGEVLKLKDTANISGGGTAVDLTEQVHPDNKFMAERIARIFNLNICGIDVITTSVEKPITRETGAVIEVNAGPGIRMHSNPQAGKSRNVAAPIINMLFPAGLNRIPVVAVTGGSASQEIVRTIADMADMAGFRVGFTSKDKVSIDKHIFKKEKENDFKNQQDVLFDPMIDFAALECTGDGILNAGLAFEKCDFAIVDGISPEFQGYDEVKSIEEMSKVQMVVPLSTRKEGYAILNADDELVYKMYPNMECKIALYSADNDSFKIDYHRKRGGIAAVISQGNIVVYDGDWSTKIRVYDAYHDPEKARKLLPACLVGILMDFKPDLLRKCFSKTAVEVPDKNS